MSDQERVAQIRARLEKITPGKWTADNFCMQDDLAVRIGTTDETDTYYHRSATIAEAWHHEFGEDIAVGEPKVDWKRAECNATFIAHAPDDVAFLLAEIAMLQAAPTPPPLPSEEEIKAVLQKATDGWFNSDNVHDGTADDFRTRAILALLNRGR